MPVQACLGIHGSSVPETFAETEILRSGHTRSLNVIGAVCCGAQGSHTRHVQMVQVGSLAASSEPTDPQLKRTNLYNFVYSAFCFS